MSRAVVRALALVSVCAAAVVSSSAQAAPAPWGDPDATYGTNGRVQISGLDADVQTGDLEVDGSGRGVLSASQPQGGGSAWLLATLGTNGAPVGPVNAMNATGVTTSPPLLLRQGSKWIQAGGTGSSWTIARRQADGTSDAQDPDTPFPLHNDSFGGASFSGVRVRALLWQSVEPAGGDDPYDRLVVVGDARTASGGRALVVGYRPKAGGGLERDPSFATTITPAVPTVGGAALSNGKIIIGGYDGEPGDSGHHLKVMRLNADGAVDSAFGTKSYPFISDLPNVAPGTTDTGRIENIVIDHQDRILLVGSGSAQRPSVYAGSHPGAIVENGAMRVVRLTPEGAMDATFAGDGNRTRQFTYVYGNDGTMNAQAAVVDSLDRVTVTGYTTNWEATESHIALFRLNTNGYDSKPFGIVSEQASVIGAGYGEALAFEPGGKLLVGGETTGAIVAQRYTMEDSGDVLEPEPVGATVSVSNGFVQVQDAPAHQVDLLVSQSGRTLTFREQREGLELIPGDGCTQETPVRVSCADVDGLQLTLDDGSDKLSVDPSVTYPVGADLGEGDDIATLVKPTSGANEIRGGDGDDTITGAAGRDRLFGEGGGDTLTGADGDDDLYGEDSSCGCAGGDDTLDGGAGFDRLQGGEGDDSLSGGADNDLLNGGIGADDVSGGAGNDLIDLGSATGPTRVRGGDGASDGQLDIDPATAGNQSEGDDYAADFEAFWGSDDADDVVIPSPNSTPADPITMAAGGDDVIVASTSSDEIRGGDGDDEIHGGGGSDSLYGDDQPQANDPHAGADKLYGDDGNDALIGGNGADLLDGGDGDYDVLYGEWAGEVDHATVDADRFIGGPGVGDSVRLGYTGDQNVTLDGVANDGRDDEDDNVEASVELVLSGSGDDNITGTAAAEQLYGGGGADVIDGAGGDDSLHGEAGDDTLRGGAGLDVLYGGADADVIDGGADNDQVDAGSGDDEITGGPGVDVVFGAQGADVLRMRDDVVDQTVNCGDDIDRAIVDTADPAAGCETAERPATGGGNGGGAGGGNTGGETGGGNTGGGQPQPNTSAQPDPNPGAPAPPAGVTDQGPLLCATRLDLYVRGSVALGAGARDGFALDVSSIASGVALGGTLTNAGTGAVLATAAPALSTGGDATTALRFALAPGAADQLASADTRVALEATAGASGCPTVTARDELTVTRSGAAAAKALLRGRVQGAAGLTALRSLQPFAAGVGPSTVDPAARRDQTYSVAVCTALAAGISLERGPCKVPKTYPPLPPSPQPACVGALALGGLRITGPCLKRDPKSGIYTAYASTGSGVGEILLNGIRIVPVAGGQISVDPAKLVLRTKGRVAISVGGMTVFEGSPQWSLGTKSFSIGKASGSLNVKGFKVSGSVGLRFSPAKEAGAAQPPLGGAVVEVSVELPTPPPPQGGKKGKLSASLGIRVNSAGQISLNDLAINVPKFTAGPIDVLPMTIKYEGKTDTWSGAARVVLPSPAKPRPQVGASFTYSKGRLTSARVTAINANLPFGPPPSSALTRLQMIDAAFKYEDALSLNGAVGFSVDTPPVAGRSKRLAELILTAGYNFKAPGQWAGSGVFKMLGDELGHAKVEYWNGGKLSFDVAARRSFGVGMTLGVEGSIKGAIERGTITGTGKTKVSAGPFAAGGTVTLSDKTLVACLDGYPGGGGTYVLETKQLKLFEGCGNPSLKDAVKKAKEDYDNLKKAKNAPKAKKSQAGAPAGGTIALGQFSVAGDLPFAVLAVEGQGGLPQGAFVAPNGTRYAAPVAGQSAPVSGGFALSDPTTNRVYLSVSKPAAGVWTFESAPGSVPLAAGLQSDGDDEPNVRAKVTGKGGSRTVEYDADLPEGMTVRFREEGEETTQDLGSPRGSGDGEVRFTPADSASRARKIVALLERDGALVGTQVVASFRATADGRPGRVSDLRVSRSGDDALRVRFDGADDADGHRIVVRLGDGGEQVVDLDGGARSALIEGVERDVSATVTVQGVNDGDVAGPATSKRIAAGKPRLQKLPKAPADGSLGVAEVVFAQLQ